VTASGGVAGGAAHEFIDLHTHSTASDGARLPADVVRAAKAAGLAAIALTDHDTLAGLAEARTEGEKLGVRIVPGIELSAVEGHHETHILGLHLTDVSEMEHRLVDLRQMRMNRALRIVERLNAIGIPMKFEAVLKEADGGAVGRPHVARAMVAGGWALDLREAFDKYLGNGRTAFVAKEKLSMADAIGLIRRAGGLAVLAHPAQTRTRERVAALVAEGLDGVEVLHPSHSWDDSQRLDALAAEFKLVRSGGSDWHGAVDGARTLGMMRVPAQWLAEHETRLEEMRSRQVA
jgi:predicted metal-dependent phosphoesterase TrpH